MPTTKSKVIEYIALATVPIVLVLGNSMLVPILPNLQNNMKISQFQSSLIITVFSLASAILIPFAGYLSDRFTRKSIIIPALILYGIAGVLSGLGAIWNSFGILIMGRVIQGIGAAGTSPISMALIGDLYNGAEESEALGMIEAANEIGKVISPIIGSLFALISWYMPFFTFPGFCLIALLAIIFMVKEPKRKKKSRKIADYLQSIKKIFAKNGSWLWASFFSGSLVLFILFGVLFFLSNILEEPPFSIEGVLKGCVLAIPLFFMVSASYITGLVIKKNGILIRWFMNVGLIVMCSALGSAIWLNANIFIFIGLLTISSIGTGLLVPCLNTMIIGIVKKSERGLITSLYNSLRFLGVALGPPLFSWMMDKSHALVFMVVSSLAFVALLLIFFLVKPQKQVK